MRGRFTLTADPGVVARRFGAPPAQGGNTRPRYNVAPTQAVVTVTDDGTRHLEQMRWGLVPRWAKDPKGGARMINARAETLAERPAYRGALRRRRCLIPADGFYEWAEGAGSRKARRPMYVRLTTGEPFAFAGLWDEWRPPEGGEPLRTCTIVTTEANALVAAFHHRMPVILAPEVEAVWLDPGLTDPAHLRSLLVPYPAAAMEAYPVSTAVNAAANEANDSERLVQPLG